MALALEATRCQKRDEAYTRLVTQYHATPFGVSTSVWFSTNWKSKRR